MERILAVTLVNGTPATQLTATFPQPVDLVSIQQHLHADRRLHGLEIHPVLFHLVPPYESDLPEVYIRFEFSTSVAKRVATITGLVPGGTSTSLTGALLNREDVGESH